jgi:hypothetical protein
VQLFEQMNVGIENLVGGRFGRNIFAQMIEANGASLCAQGSAGGENFVERFTGYESPREAVFHAATRDRVGYAGLGREPKNEIAGEQRFILGNDSREYG